MTRRTFLFGLTLATLAAPLDADAQQAPRLQVIGILSPRYDRASTLGLEARIVPDPLSDRGWLVHLQPRHEPRSLGC